MKIVFSLLIFLIIPFLNPQTVAACDTFQVPSSIVAGKEFTVTVNGVRPGFSYRLNVAKEGVISRSGPGYFGPTLATTTSLSFSGSLASTGIYKLDAYGTDNRSIDTCTAGNALTVTAPWRINEKYECVEDIRAIPGFGSKEECEVAAAQQKPIQIPPLPFNCVEGVDKNGKITNDKKLMQKCTKIETALGPFDIEPASFIKNIFGILLSLAGGVALLLIIFSGYRLMTSQGNPEKVQEAREQLTSAIVGLLFVIFSIAILTIIGVDILKIPGFER